ncbi:MAG TPA: hypothetical protein PLT69_13680 [Deltaproteobacteria bacterium]|nr:hypothetical protein [Deltaproteobacteria bacterium]
MFKTLKSDLQAVLKRDPAAKSIWEIMLCYPGFRAVRMHRRANRLYRHKWHLLARMTSEWCRFTTGIDIHPGASIGERFFIDHGTGTVIGETCIIGSNVRLYQGVTLGAKSFPKDEAGRLVKGIPRHPIVEDDVIIYSGTTILGRVTIGRGSVIGGNVWLDHDVAPYSTVIQADGASTVVVPSGKGASIP